jgi:hypothetical protein
MMSSINDVAKLYDEFEEAFVDVMTAKSEGLSFSRRMKLRLARSRLRAHKDFTQRREGEERLGPMSDGTAHTSSS